MDNKAIGERIKKARTSRGLTILDVALEIGVAKSTISRYERGEINELKLPVISAIANALGVNDAWILGRDDRMVLTDAERFARFAEQYNTAHQFFLTAEERKHLDTYKKLDKPNRDKADAYILKLLDIQADEELLLKAAHKRTDITTDRDAEVHDIEEMNKF